MRYYVTCVNMNEEQILIIVKGATEKEALDYLIEKYKGVRKVLKVATTPPVTPEKDKNCYASVSGFHVRRQSQTSKRGSRYG